MSDNNYPEDPLTVSPEYNPEIIEVSKVKPFQDEKNQAIIQDGIVGNVSKIENPEIPDIVRNHNAPELDELSEKLTKSFGKREFPRFYPEYSLPEVPEISEELRDEVTVLQNLWDSRPEYEVPLQAEAVRIQEGDEDYIEFSVEATKAAEALNFIEEHEALLEEFRILQENTKNHKAYAHSGRAKYSLELEDE